MFLKYVKNKLGDYFPIIVEELGFLGVIDEPEVLVIRKLQGTNFKGSKIQPIQFEIKTHDVNKTFKILEDYIRDINGTFIGDGINYIKQNYSTPYVQQLFNSSGNNVSGTITLSATLVYTENISDIESINIDGEDIYFDTIDENYVASEDSVKEYNSNLFKTTIRGGINKLQIGSLVFNNGLIQKVRNIKSGLSDDNDTFNVKIKYMDTDVVFEYVMKLSSYSSSHASSNIPFATISLTQ